LLVVVVEPLPHIEPSRRVWIRLENLGPGLPKRGFNFPLVVAKKSWLRFRGIFGSITIASNGREFTPSIFENGNDESFC
jgi:hypothetical protein